VAASSHGEAPAGYPRVLIIGGSFDLRTGDGITSTNLFGGWPSDSIALVTENERFDDWSTCTRYYQIGFAETRYPWPISWVQPSTR
jgi:hypothetical protein